VVRPVFVFLNVEDGGVDLLPRLTRKRRVFQLFWAAEQYADRRRKSIISRVSRSSAAQNKISAGSDSDRPGRHSSVNACQIKYAAILSL
jgi:hypothetical protein